ncbi:MAG TPA: hypothetical protein VFQ91_28870 [Bryobacteraceae bacterium]|nr:hypothetical protein [Bryobacteraceae bacterium]
MTEEEIGIYLEDNGFPAHIVRAGSAGLVSRWQEFVAEVERGYSYGLSEYRHDLDIRGAIAVLELEDRVTDADARFEGLLVRREIRVWESGGGQPWWDFGFPRNTGGRLLRDLRAAGVPDEEL